MCAVDRFCPSAVVPPGYPIDHPALVCSRQRFQTTWKLPGLFHSCRRRCASGATLGRRFLSGSPHTAAISALRVTLDGFPTPLPEGRPKCTAAQAARGGTTAGTSGPANGSSTSRSSIDVLFAAEPNRCTSRSTSRLSRPLPFPSATRATTTPCPVNLVAATLCPRRDNAGRRMPGSGTRSREPPPAVREYLGDDYPPTSLPDRSAGCRVWELIVAAHGIWSPPPSLHRQARARLAIAEVGDLPRDHVQFSPIAAISGARLHLPRLRVGRGSADAIVEPRERLGRGSTPRPPAGARCMPLSPPSTRAWPEWYIGWRPSHEVGPGKSPAKPGAQPVPPRLSAAGHARALTRGWAPPPSCARARSPPSPKWAIRGRRVFGSSCSDTGIPQPRAAASLSPAAARSSGPRIPAEAASRASRSFSAERQDGAFVHPIGSTWSRAAGNLTHSRAQ